MGGSWDIGGSLAAVVLPNCSGISGVSHSSSRDELDTVLDLSTFSKDSWSSFLGNRRCSKCPAGEDLAEDMMGSGLR